MAQNVSSHLKLSWRRRRSLALAAAAGASVVLMRSPVASATIYTWNNAGTDWGTAGDWSPSGGPPTGTDTALFDPQVGSGSTVNNPDIAGSVAAGNVSINNTFLGGNYGFTDSGTLTIGSGGIAVRGVGTTTINGPILAGAASGNLILNIGTDSGLTFQGATTASSNAGQVSIYGGTLTLDNSGTNQSGRLSTGSTIVINAGTLSAIGNSAGSAFNVGTLNVTAGATTPAEGLVNISVTANTTSSPTSLNFANTGSVNLRTTTAMVYDFIGVGGALGSANGPQITFTGTPITNASTGVGMICGATSGSTEGFAIATDSVNGTGWATYVAPSGGTGGIEVLAPSTTATTAANLQALTAASVADFTPAGNTTTTLTAASTTGSLRINPGGNATLALGTNVLKTQGLMLIGSNDFTITGTGTGVINGGSTQNYWVINPSTTLNISCALDGTTNNGNPVNIDGAGFISLTGSANQLTNTGTNKLNLDNGTLRGNSTEMDNLTSAATTMVFGFRGGVLEIAGGSDGSGASADFSRVLGQGAGNVDWNTTTTTGDNIGGSGGFSAFGANASVNIGGSASPSTLTWNSTNFVADGYALVFGSTKSNARLDFLNNLALDGGSPGNYFAREIKVIGGAGGDETNMHGSISGSSSTDLIKTGTGVLALSGANNYAGGTLVEAGTLYENGTNSGAGSVSVNSGGTLGGTGSTGGSVTVNSGGIVTAGTITTVVGTSTPTSGNLLTSGTNQWNGGGKYRWKLFDAGTPGTSQLTSQTGGTSSTWDNLTMGALTVGSASAPISVTNGNPFTIAVSSLTGNATTPTNDFNSASGYSWIIGTVSGLTVNGTPIPTSGDTPLTTGSGSDAFALDTSAFNSGSGNSLPAGGGFQLDAVGTGSADNIELTYSFAAAPEPGTALLVLAGAMPLVTARRRRRTSSAANVN